jgi:nitrogen-specific signal transduction histidine kinase
LIEQHGGRLGYESTPGHGTTAIIDLPAQAAERSGRPRLTPVALRAGSGAG